MRPRLTILGLMAVVLSVALGFAALKGANRFLFAVLFQATVVALVLALMWAVFRKGRLGPFFGGFSLCGTVYLLLVFFTDVSPSLVTNGVLMAAEKLPYFQAPPRTPSSPSNGTAERSSGARPGTRPSWSSATSCSPGCSGSRAVWSPFISPAARRLNARLQRVKMRARPMGTTMRGLRFNLSTLLVAVLFAAFDSWCLADSGKVTEGGFWAIAISALVIAGYARTAGRAG